MCTSSPKVSPIEPPDPVVPPPAPATPVAPQLTPTLQTDKRGKRKKNPLTISRPNATGVNLPTIGTGVNVPN